jgi:hypothetical protein
MSLEITSDKNSEGARIPSQEDAPLENDTQEN